VVREVDIPTAVISGERDGVLKEEAARGVSMTIALVTLDL
jgi:hypothetical protein